jgi:prepilin-type N-terminal cleavage/methylation domain-containing protein
MPRRLLTDQRGFTIVEVLVAAVVLGIGLSGAATMFDTASSTTTTTKAREQGVNLAREIVEDARSIPYAQLTPSSIVGKLQAMPGLNNNNPGPNPGWTIARRGVIYTVAAGVCSVDDPADGYGVEDPNLFCASTTGKPSTPCWKLLDTGQITGDVKIVNQINTTLSGQVSIGACGLDLNLTGRVSDLTQAEVALCLGGTCQNQPSTGDPTPDDYKRITVLVTWGVGNGSRYVLQSAAVNNPGLASGPHVQTLAPAFTPVVWLFTSTPAGGLVPFNATADASANSVQWSVNGVPQGTAANVAGTWTFNWPIYLVPPVGGGSEVLDGNYTIGVTAFDTNANAGPPLSTTVTLARRVPYAPNNFAGGHDGSFIDFQWAPNKEGDITGYRVNRVGGLGQQDVLVCSTTNVRATACQDTNPPASASIQYYVYAVDSEGKGDNSATLTVTTPSLAPSAPTILQASSSNGNTVLAWTASSTPDFYRIYRDGQQVANRYDTAPGNATSYTDTQTGGVQHTYWVTAVSAQLAESTPLGPVTK